MLASLNESLREVGLGGKIRLGVPQGPIPRPHAHTPNLSSRDDGILVGASEEQSQGPDSARVMPASVRGARKTGAEEDDFPLDILLRPLDRSFQGRLIELAGEPSSGRTSLAYRLAAGATLRGELVGWVDLPDALDPRFLRRSGIDLSLLLWSRPPNARAALRAAELLTKAGFAVVVLDLEGASANELQRLGSAAWSRFLRALRGARGTGVVLGPARVSGAHSTLGLYTERCDPVFDRDLFEGLVGVATVVRNRTGATDTSHAFRVHHRPS